MDKQTGSNSASSPGTNESPRDISLGCGPSSSAQASSAAAASSASTAVGNASGSTSASSAAATTAGRFAPASMMPMQQTLMASPAAGSSIALPLGATVAGAATPPPLKLNINTTTGGSFSVIVDASNTVENLKKVIAKKLKVAKDRICLLHREKELQDGTLKDNGLMDGSKIILIPNVETGLLAQRPENTVMQALESLNDSQVNDFLSGKTPLNLSMRLGDHMMLIQLQLSTVNPVTTAAHSSSSTRTRSSQRSSRSSSSSSSSASSATSATGAHSHHHHHHHHHHTTNGATGSTSVASTSTAARKLDVEAATAATTAALNTQRQRSSTESGSSSSSATVVPGIRLPGSTIRSSDLSSFLSKRDYESLQNIVRSIAMAQPTKMAPPQKMSAAAAAAQLEQIATNMASYAATNCCNGAVSSSKTTTAPATAFHAAETALLEQSPIKSLSNLVSSPIKTTAIKNIPITSGGNSCSSATTAVSATAAASAVATCQDPISAKLTSCLCTRLAGAGGASISSGSTALKSCIESSCQSRQESSTTSIAESRSAMLTSTPNFKTSSSTAIAATAASSSSLLHKTANNAIVRSKHRHHHHHHHHHHHYHHHGNNSSSSNSPAGSSSISGSTLRKVVASPRCASALSTSTNDSGFVSENDSTSIPTSTPVQQTVAAAAATATIATPNTTPVDLDDSGVVLTDTRTLAEASRNLTQTLRKLSKEVFTNKIDLSSEETSRKSSSGAVIESMKNHGKGIYSGTFSGTLNPALQDRYGRPKRDISTVIHILNDLLSATPQYSRGARISFEAPSTSSAAAAATAAGHASRSKQFPSKHHHNYAAHSADSCVKCSKSSHHSAGASTTSASSSSTACAYGECNGHYAGANKQAKHTSSSSASYACCQDLSTSSSSHHHHHHAADASDRNTCSCRYRIVSSETGEQREREHMCQKCLVEMENSKTKSKLDQLRLVMQQRKQKREARKLMGAPYGARVVGATTGVADASATVTAAATTAGGQAASSATAPLTAPLATASPSEVSPNHIVEEVNTAA